MLTRSSPEFGDGSVTGRRHTSGEATTIHYEHLACHVIGRSRGQPDGDRTELTREPGAADGNEVSARERHGSSVSRLGREEAGNDSVTCDAITPQADSHGSRDVHNPALTCGIHVVVTTAPETKSGSDIDDLS